MVRLLRDLGAEVAYHDPHVAELPEQGLASVELDGELADADMVAIVTAHPEIDYEALVARASLVLDFRGVTRGISSENLVRM
jgi:UDP-N-acetyl-D-glucosamine dehydrogenase